MTTNEIFVSKDEYIAIQDLISAAEERMIPGHNDHLLRLQLMVEVRHLLGEERASKIPCKVTIKERD